MLDTFVPSKILAGRILHEQRKVEFRRGFFPFVYTNRLDVTPTEAPNSPFEKPSVHRAQQSIAIRMSRFFGGIARRGKRGELVRIPIATKDGFADDFAAELKKDLGFTDKLDLRMRIRKLRMGTVNYNWVNELLEELRAWLRAKPEHRQRWLYGTMELHDDGSIDLLPTTKD